MDDTTLDTGDKGSMKKIRTVENEDSNSAHDLVRRREYDPLVPDQVQLREQEQANPDFNDTPVGRAEHFESTRGEELRPKDGSLDPSSAR